MGGLLSRCLLWLAVLIAFLRSVRLGHAILNNEHHTPRPLRQRTGLRRSALGMMREVELHVSTDSSSSHQAFVSAVYHNTGIPGHGVIVMNQIRIWVLTVPSSGDGRACQS